MINVAPVSSPALFDYSALDAGAAISVRDASTRIKCRMARTALDIIEIGRDLIEVKKTVGHGNFLNWISSEFGMTDRTADRFINSARHIGNKFDTVSDLSPSVLYALAAPSTPEDVRTEVVERVERGESVSVADIKALKEKLADRDAKLRQIKSQKESVDAHVGRLIEDVQRKDSEVVRLSDQLEHMKEEVRRASEPGTITVQATQIPIPRDAPEKPLAPVPAQDIGPWKLLVQQVWTSAPEEVRAWMRNFVLTGEVD